MQSNIDQLIADLNEEARRLLWVIALANHPVNLYMLSILCGEQIHELMPLLRQLLSVELVTEDHKLPQDDNTLLICHELVRERVLIWMDHHEQDRGELTHNSIRYAYAYLADSVFNDLLHENRDAALEAGIHAIVYCAQAKDYESLSLFAGKVVTSISDPQLLEELLPHLEVAAESAPEGKARWRCLGILADALEGAGRPGVSLSYYEQAAAQLRAAVEAGGEGERMAWDDLGWINGNWARTLLITGELNSSRQRNLNAAEAFKQAGSPAINVVLSELKALQIDIIDGKVEEVLLEVKRRLAQIEGWWNQYLSGQSVEEAPDPVFLARALISALTITYEAHTALEDWEVALKYIDACLEVERTLNRSAEDIAGTLINRAVALVELKRLDEAKAELDKCLEIFQNDPDNRSKVIDTLASLFDAQGDVAEAIRHERLAIAIIEQLPDPRSRATSHGCLAVYLERSGDRSAMVESSRHQLAALIYRLVCGLWQGIQVSMRNYVRQFRNSSDSESEIHIPPLAAVLSDPAFRSLGQWLKQRQVDPDELQAAVDQFLDQARQAARTGVSQSNSSLHSEGQKSR